MRIRVAFDLRKDDTYDYLVPQDLQDQVAVGVRVDAPLGRSSRTGYIVALNPPEQPGLAYKPITAVREADQVISQDAFELARFISAYYACPLGKALHSFVPAAVRRRSAAAVEVFVVRPAKPLDEIHQHLATLSRRAARQASVLTSLLDFYTNHPDDAPGLRLAELTARADTSTSVVRRLEELGWLSISREHQPLTEGDAAVPSGAPALTPRQQAAVDAIIAARDRFAPFLLHGVTGSGKTEVYLRVIADVLDRGRSALVLVPEIALTPQAVERFRSRFGQAVAVLHSNLADFERCKQWWSIKRGEARIAVGARSAVFAPLDNLGLIVVDEEHERTYKQAEEIPRYNARDVAVMRAKIARCPVVLGSATPSLESFHNVRKQKYALLELPERVVAEGMPSIELVDLREEARVAPHLAIISRALRNALDQCLARGEQALLFLNRRGYCPVLACPSCGAVHSCSHCAVSLTYHHSSKSLMCHLCGASEPYSPPYTCPECGGRFALRGFGTERVERTLAHIFPDARVSRFDRDTTARRGSHERILTAFAHGAIDILLGTQMVAKGHDYPNVTVVGVINADVSLHVPDFRAAETTYQLITQVAGRAGRGTKAGRVFVQSFTPDHPAVACAVRGAWSEFAARELTDRSELSYPPFAHLVYVIAKGKDEERVIHAARELAIELEQRSSSGSARTAGVISVNGPAPAPLALAHGYHRWQYVIKTHNVVTTLVRVIRPAIRAKKLPGVQIIIDVDPL